MNIHEPLFIPFLLTIMKHPQNTFKHSFTSILPIPYNRIVDKR